MEVEESIRELNGNGKKNNKNKRLKKEKKKGRLLQKKKKKQTPNTFKCNTDKVRGERPVFEASFM